MQLIATQRNNGRARRELGRMCGVPGNSRVDICEGCGCLAPPGSSLSASLTDDGSVTVVAAIIARGQATRNQPEVGDGPDLDRRHIPV